MAVRHAARVYDGPDLVLKERHHPSRRGSLNSPTPPSPSAQRLWLRPGQTPRPLELLFGMPVPGAADGARQRAAAANYLLDLVEATTGT